MPREWGKGDVMKVTCRECKKFTHGYGSGMALGRCTGKPWDGHVGQWPYSKHPCTSFVGAEGGSAPSSGSRSDRNSKTSEGEVSWVCRTCQCDVAYKHYEFLRHVLNVHGFDPRGIKGTKYLVSHIDARDQFINVYAWEIGGVEAVQTVCVTRMKAR
jgi:hypothetical protein